MNNNDKIFEITNRLISELSEKKPSNLLMAVKTHYDFWQSELIILLKERNIGVNEYLAMLLKECGYENATADKVRAYMNKVSKTKIPPSKTSPIPDLGITNKIDMINKEIPPKAAQSVSVGRNNDLGVEKVVNEPVVQRVSIKGNTNAPLFNLDEYPFKEHSIRLKNEVNDIFNGKGGEWSDVDNELLAVFSQISCSRYTPIVKLAQSFQTNENIKQDCFGAFKIKCKEMGIDLTKHGFQ